MRNILASVRSRVVRQALQDISYHIRHRANMAHSTMIEIERKFVIPTDCEKKLAELGATPIQNKTFRDIYYDTDTHKLTLNDHWLRQRDGIWQLKLPPLLREKDKKTAQYVELASEGEIISHLTRVLDTSSSPDTDLSTLVLNNCLVFADFVTSRKSFQYENCRFDLDNTSFDFCVGEVEVLVSSQEEMTGALLKVDSIATKLGFVSETRVPGKLDAYLRKTNPAHYQALVDAKILGDEYAV